MRNYLLATTYDEKLIFGNYWWSIYRVWHHHHSCNSQFATWSHRRVVYSRCMSYVKCVKYMIQDWSNLNSSSPAALLLLDSTWAIFWVNWKSDLKAKEFLGTSPQSVSPSTGKATESLFRSLSGTFWRICLDMSLACLISFCCYNMLYKWISNSEKKM